MAVRSLWDAGRLLEKVTLRRRTLVFDVVFLLCPKKSTGAQLPPNLVVQATYRRQRCFSGRDWLLPGAASSRNEADT